VELDPKYIDVIVQRWQTFDNQTMDLKLAVKRRSAV